jgi:hypothetical protein
MKAEKMPETMINQCRKSQRLRTPTIKKVWNILDIFSLIKIFLKDLPLDQRSVEDPLRKKVARQAMKVSMATPARRATRLVVGEKVRFLINLTPFSL